MSDSQRRAYFGGHESSADGDIVYLICHVTSHDHLIEGSCKFIGGSSLRYFTTVIGFMAIRFIVIMEICF